MTIEEEILQLQGQLKGDATVPPGQSVDPLVAQGGDVQVPIGQSVEDEDPVASEIQRLQQALGGDEARARAAAQPAQREGDFNATMNFFRAFNHRLGNAIDFPGDFGMAVTRHFGLTTPEQAEKFKAYGALNAMRQAGIKVDPLEGLSKEIGEEAFNTVISGAILQSMASRMASMGGSAARNAIAEMGKFMEKHPWLTAWMDQWASAGGVVGSEVTGSPLGAIPGAIAGGMGGAATGGAIRRMMASETMQMMGDTARGVGRAVADYVVPPGPNTLAARNAADQARNQARNIYDHGLRDPNIDGTATQGFAQNQMDAMEQRISQEVQNAINSVPRAGTPEQSASTFRAGLENAERIAARLENQAWGYVRGDRPVPMTDLVANVEQLVARNVDRPSELPMDHIEAIRLLGQGPTPNITRLRDVRGQIFRDRRAEQASASAQGRPPNWGLIARMNELEGIIDDAITAQYPNDTRLAQARAASIMYNDWFSRSGIADILRMRQSGDPLVVPEETMQRLLNQPNSQRTGLQALVNMQDEVRSHPRFAQQGNTSLTASTPRDRQQLTQMQRDAEQNLRDEWRARAEQDPQGAARWFERNQSSIAHFGRLSGELEQAGQRLVTAEASRRDLQNSALSRWAQMEPDKAAANLWNSPDPVARVRELLTTFRNDPDALAGLRANVLDELWRRSNLDPTKLRSILDTPRYSNLLREVLDPQELSRLGKIATAAEQLAGVGIWKGRSLGAKLVTPVTIIGRVIAAGIGRTFTNTLQGPSLLSNAAARGIERAFKGFDAPTLMGLAIRDPKWERILLRRTPTTSAEWRDLNRNVKRLLTVKDSQQRMISSTLEGDNDE